MRMIRRNVTAPSWKIAFPNHNCMHACLLLLVVAMSRPILAADPPPGECPQPRFTGKAPAEYLARTNPLASNAETLAAGETIYNGKSRSVPCAICHGTRGDGKGPLASQYNPRPRNFACKATVNGIPDGQLFWIVRYGSPGTAMPPSKDLTEEQIWQVVAYMRQLARP